MTMFVKRRSNLLSLLSGSGRQQQPESYRYNRKKHTVGDEQEVVVQAEGEEVQSSSGRSSQGRQRQSPAFDEEHAVQQIERELNKLLKTQTQRHPYDDHGDCDVSNRRRHLTKGGTCRSPPPPETVKVEVQTERIGSIMDTTKIRSQLPRYMYNESLQKEIVERYDWVNDDDDDREMIMASRDDEDQTEKLRRLAYYRRLQHPSSRRGGAKASTSLSSSSSFSKNSPQPAGPPPNTTITSKTKNAAIMREISGLSEYSRPANARRSNTTGTARGRTNESTESKLQKPNSSYGLLCSAVGLSWDEEEEEETVEYEYDDGLRRQSNTDVQRRIGGGTRDEEELLRRKAVLNGQQLIVVERRRKAGTTNSGPAAPSTNAVIQAPRSSIEVFGTLDLNLLKQREVSNLTTDDVLIEEEEEEVCSHSTEPWHLHNTISPRRKNKQQDAVAHYPIQGHQKPFRSCLAKKTEFAYRDNNSHSSLLDSNSNNVMPGGRHHREQQHLTQLSSTIKSCESHGTSGEVSPQSVVVGRRHGMASVHSASTTCSRSNGTHGEPSASWYKPATVPLSRRATTLSSIREDDRNYDGEPDIPKKEEMDSGARDPYQLVPVAATVASSITSRNSTTCSTPSSQYHSQDDEDYNSPQQHRQRQQQLLLKRLKKDRKAKPIQVRGGSRSNPSIASTSSSDFVSLVPTDSYGSRGSSMLGYTSTTSADDVSELTDNILYHKRLQNRDIYRCVTPEATSVVGGCYWPGAIDEFWQSNADAIETAVLGPIEDDEYYYDDDTTTTTTATSYYTATETATTDHSSSNVICLPQQHRRRRSRHQPLPLRDRKVTFYDED